MIVRFILVSLYFRVLGVFRGCFRQYDPGLNRKQGKVLKRKETICIEPWRIIDLPKRRSNNIRKTVRLLFDSCLILSFDHYTCEILGS